MNAFFDTSALVPVFYGDHVHHQASLGRFIRFDKSTGCCGAHSLAEVYSTLTRMKPTITIGGKQADVAYAGVIEPGVYQFNVTIPPGTAAGDNALIATYNGVTRQSGVLISVQP